MPDVQAVVSKISVRQLTFSVVQASGQMHLHSAYIRQVLRFTWNLQETVSLQISLLQVLLLRLHSADHALAQVIHRQIMHSVSVIQPETSRTVKAPRFRTDRFLLSLLWMQDLSQQQQQIKVS